ncbi:LOW QUALITY PROTEIN: golgin subfamily A member 5 [Mantella aurantiaca]
MSWLVDLAGKAEDLLNLVDQGAATALSKSKEAEAILTSAAADYAEHNPDKPKEKLPSYAKSGFIASAADNIKNQKATLLAGTANVKSGSRMSVETAHGGSTASSHRTSSHFVRRKKSEPDDEQLFDFLNSSDKVHNGAVEPRKEIGREVTGYSAGPNSAKIAQSASPKTERRTPDFQPADIPQEDKVLDSKASDTSSTSSHGNGDQKSHELSNLRLENQLLRNEVQSLNQEMATLIQRSKETQEALTEARVRIEKWNGDNSKSDRAVRELVARVDDLTEAAAAKDSQLAVLKVRLQEADQLLSCRTEALEVLQSEKSRILHDHSEGSGSARPPNSQALTECAGETAEAEASLKREQDDYKQMQNEFSARLSKMEAERQNLVDCVVAAEKKHMEEKRRCDDLQQQMKLHVSTGRSEQSVICFMSVFSFSLQSKEKLISSLKEGSTLEGLDSHITSSMELEETRHERDMQREEIQKLLAQTQLLKAELQELQYTQEDFHRTKNTLQGRIRDREDEIQKLRNQLTNKALSSSSQTELENRLHQLTETLIQKQTMLESLSTEKNSLVYQLERLETQMKSIQGNGGGGSAINMAAVDSGDGARLRNVPVLFSDSDTNVAGVYGRVRKAATTIDQFSIRLGIFLRRYPIARLFIIIYMALLHLWVMIVLLTYTPEMHHDHPSGK